MSTYSHPSKPNDSEAIRLVLGIARKLHRAAGAESLALSMPVLRRLLATQTLRDISLAELRRRKAMVQRKHVLRMLAVEARFTSWESYREALATMTPAQLTHFDLVSRSAGYPNHWFSSEEDAQRHTASHGGVAMRVGGQGVVLGGR